MIVLSEVSAPIEGVRVQQPQVNTWMENQSMGEGTLTISDSAVTWIDRASGKGFSLSYPSIILHAVSTDLSSFPHECVYVLVDASQSAPRRRHNVPLFTAVEAQIQQDLNIADAELNGEDSDDEEPKNVSIRFVPADVSVLSQIYNEMCACQELHPDEDDDFSGEDGDEEMAGDGILQMGAGEVPEGRWFNAENISDAELSEEGLANLQRMLGGRQTGHQQGNDGDMEQ